MSADKRPIKVAGAVTGMVYITSLDDTVGTLRAELGRVIGVEDPAAVKVICAGRTLQDDSKSLNEYGICWTSRLLVTSGAAAANGMSMGEQTARRLEKLKAAAEKMAARDGRGLTDDYEFSIENQDGSNLHLKPEDRKALVSGMALHAKAKATMKKGDFSTAISELMLAEQYFDVCDKALTEAVDNVPLLLIDIVWCCYKLQDPSRLATCKTRLDRARASLARAHGPNLERLRFLHGNFNPELATYLRLDVMSGVVAFYQQDLEAAVQHLQSAKAKWERLQVSDADLAQLQELGYRTKESRRALRFSGGDLNAAVTFITQQRERQEDMRQERKKQRSWLHDRVQYGKAPSGNYVDQQFFERLCMLGHDKTLVGEALRAADNDVNVALDSLVDPAKQAALQRALLTRSLAAGVSALSQVVDEAAARQLVDQGFKESFVRHALATEKGDLDAAVAFLLSLGDIARGEHTLLGDVHVPPELLASTSQQGAAAGNDGMEVEAMLAEMAGMADGAHGARQGHSEEAPAEPVDAEEEELKEEIRRGVKEDPLAAYDVEVDEEAEALQEFWAVVEEARNKQQQHA